MSERKICPLRSGEGCAEEKCAFWCTAGPDLEAAIGFSPPKGVPKSEAVCSILGLANAAVGRAYGEIMALEGMRFPDGLFDSPPKEDNA